MSTISRRNTLLVKIKRLEGENKALITFVSNFIGCKARLDKVSRIVGCGV